MQRVMPHLQREYSAHGGWEHLRGDSDRWARLLRPDLAHGHEGPVPPLSDQTGVPSRLGLFDAQHRFVAGNPDATSDDEPHAVQVDGHTVGWLGMVPFQTVIATNDLNFYNTQMRAWWVIGIALLLVTVLLAWLVSRALRQRLAKLATATHRLAAGDYATRIERTSDDELDALVNDFNRMAQALDDTERNRRAFIADISHELRTPLAVVRAELEAIEDGIRPLDRANLGALQGEIRQLGKLIDDLHDLSMTQSGGLAYRFAPLDWRRCCAASSMACACASPRRGWHWRRTCPPHRCRYPVTNDACSRCWPICWKTHCATPTPGAAYVCRQRACLPVCS